MTRHTPEFLRARSSNLSLRSVAVEQSMAMRSEAIDNTVDAKDLRPEAFTKPYVEFMTENPTVFHAVDYFKEKLLKVGYKELSSRDSWAGKLEPGGKYFTTRNGSSIIGFAVGAAYEPGNGIAMIAGHIDALTARLKPTSKKPNTHGYLQLGVASTLAP